MFSKGGEDRTYYIGRTNNRIKIYNKKIESGLDYDLTRLEITSQLDYVVNLIDFYNYNVILPDLFLNNYLYTFKDYDDKTLLAVLYAVQSGFNLNDLTRRYKDKVKSLLSGDYKIELDNTYCTEVIKNCIKHIFCKE